MTTVSDALKRDCKIALYILEYQQERGYAISLRELADHFGMSTSATYERILKLRDKGIVDWIPGDNRTMHLTDDGKSVLTTEQMFGILGENSNAPA